MRRSWQMIITVLLLITVCTIGWKTTEAEKGMHEEGEARKEEVVGSRPPRCEHKCGRCTPCVVSQVPTGAALEYANYVPEGWKCKCGSSFFDP